VKPCLNQIRSDCPKILMGCIQDSDPFGCMSRVNNMFMDGIVRCFDEKCEPLDENTN
jgi:hypothetical protein